MDVNRVSSAAVQASQHRQQTKELTSPALEPAEEIREQPNKIKFTRAEKEYFADAFPAAAKEIRQHVLYQKTGVQRSSSLGSVVDRRG